jgi:hypothetical protein
MNPRDLPTPFIWPGITKPPVIPAAQAALDDQAEVLGVAAAGKFRAYAIRAFQLQTDHIVNDLIKDVPVTVTYCNQTNCHKVFTSDDRGAPLKVDLGGMGWGEMLLKVGESFYGQKTGEPFGSSEARFRIRSWQRNEPAGRTGKRLTRIPTSMWACRKAAARQIGGDAPLAPAV